MFWQRSASKAHSLSIPPCNSNKEPIGNSLDVLLHEPGETDRCSGDRDLVWEASKCWSLLKSLLSSSSGLHCWQIQCTMWKPIFSHEYFHDGNSTGNLAIEVVSHASGSWDENNGLLTLPSFFSLPFLSLLFLPPPFSLRLLLPLFRSPTSSYVGCILSHCYHSPFIFTRENTNGYRILQTYFMSVLQM